MGATKRLSWYHNEIIWYYVGSAACLACLVAAFGRGREGATAATVVCTFFVVQSATAILLFETVNYLEHYGLERRVKPGVSAQAVASAPTADVYEPVQPQHSWDSPCRLTNHIMRMLANATRLFRRTMSRRSCRRVTRL